jgi:hypothetical protein
VDAGLILPLEVVRPEVCLFGIKEDQTPGEITSLKRSSQSCGRLMFSFTRPEHCRRHPSDRGLRNLKSYQLVGEEFAHYYRGLADDDNRVALRMSGLRRKLEASKERETALGVEPSSMVAKRPHHPADLLRSPGASTDFVPRLSADHMSRSQGVNAVVVNRPGANGMIGVHAGIVI